MPSNTWAPMKLTRLYSNRPDLFEPVEFRSGLNVVKAEIRLPENREKDVHNLGKTTLGRLIDFTLLLGKHSEFFLFKHFSAFEPFVFFLEIKLLDSTYLTVRRSVAEATKISFKKHAEKFQDFSTTLAEEIWDHYNLPFDRAREMLDSLLDLRGLSPWSFRRGMGYLLRTQDDYRDVIQLRNFMGKHADWKPFVAHILGFDAPLISDYYEKEAELEAANAQEDTIRGELVGSVEDFSNLEGILQLKKAEAERKQRLLDSFDFRNQDKEQTKILVGEIDARISELNTLRYSAGQNRKKIEISLKEDRILFDPNQAEKLFKEAGVYFGGQIKKDFQQLISFNRAITDERQKYLKEELADLKSDISRFNTELNRLGKKRSESLSFLSETDVFEKYKKVTDELVTLRADIATKERQRELFHRLQKLGGDIRDLKADCSKLHSKIESDVNKKGADEKSLFGIIRQHFSDIVDSVINRKALLGVRVNAKGHLAFRTEILDDAGNSTSADDGHSYRKLLCIAFDLAILRGHLAERYPRFTFHDGVFETLDNRKKENLLDVLRSYNDLGIQTIITLIDSDIPDRSEEAGPFFHEDEIVLTLHDEGDQGRLFKMPAW